MDESVVHLLQEWNTPAVYNGWEAVSRHSRLTCFNRDPVTQFTPQRGTMAGYAVTVVIEPSNEQHTEHEGAWDAYRNYVASIDGPKVVVVQDLDKPQVYGAFWGEVNTNIHLSLGCVGTITDGGIRDIDEIRATPFNAMGKALCVGHAWSYPVRWGCTVEVFGCPVSSGQLIHADQHGFLVIPEEDQTDLLESISFLDALERSTVIPAAVETRGRPYREVVERLTAADDSFRTQYSKRFSDERTSRTI